MTNIEALNVLKPDGNTQEKLKTAYRQACKQYHPDVNPNGLELMKVVNAAYAFLQKNLGSWDYGEKNNDISITEKMQGIFDKIKYLVKIKAEVCGSWLWVSGETYQHRAALKKLVCIGREKKNSGIGGLLTIRSVERRFLAWIKLG